MRALSEERPRKSVIYFGCWFAFGLFHTLSIEFQRTATRLKVKMIKI